MWIRSGNHAERARRSSTLYRDVQHIAHSDDQIIEEIRVADRQRGSQDDLVSLLLTAVESGVNSVEREGLRVLLLLFVQSADCNHYNCHHHMLAHLVMFGPFHVEAHT